MIRAAIVGLGRWGRTLVNAVQGHSAELRFVQAIDTAPQAAQAFCDQHGMPLANDLGVALRDPQVQAIVLVTPHSLHREQVEACARAGKPVFCDKPLALTRADALAMVQACARAGVVLGVGHNRRFWPSTQAIAQMLAAGELGQLLHIEGHNSNENSNQVLAGWRTQESESPGGGMTGSGLHVLDTMVGLVGPVRQAHATLTHFRDELPPLDTATASLRFANGMSGLLTTIRATPLFWRIHVFGTRGSAEALGAHALVVRRSGMAPERIALPVRDAERDQLEAFAAAVAGRAPFPVTPAQMLDTVSAFEAVIASMRVGETVAIDEAFSTPRQPE